MAAAPELSPLDEHNLALLANVHPSDWTNPEPAPRYNLVVLGAGTAGLVCAAGAAGLGARVALVEKGLLGGDCLNVGCVPSKTLLRAARAAAEVRDAARFGIAVRAPVEVDFGAVMERVRRVRAGISPHDSASRFRNHYGVDVFLGEGRFTGPGTLEVDDVRLRFERAVVATGARAVVPEIPGLAEAGFLSNETVFNLTARPARLAVLGGGPIGCELAQAFARLGSRVVLVQRNRRLLPRDDADAAAVVAHALAADGVELRLGTTVDRVEPGRGASVLHLETGGEPAAVEADVILVAVGRRANVEGLGLEAAGVGFDGRGVLVNDLLRTANRRIFAAGDVCSAYKFTHAADAMARLVIQNAFFPFAGRRRMSRLIIPWCTYTDPEIGHVGLTPEGAAAQHVEVASFTTSLGDVDRSVAEGEKEGFVRLHVKAGSDEIVGATVVARHAGEIVSEITTAMAGEVGLGGLASVIHPYPTVAEAVRKVGDAYNHTRLTPGRAAWLRRYFAWRR